MSTGRPGSAGGRARRGRLSRSADFDRVYRQGRATGGRVLVLHAFPRGDEAEPRLGLSVSRKVGGAVDRNKVKRLIREAFRLEVDRVRPGHDVVVVARPDVRELADREGLAGVRAALAELLERAGVIAGAAGPSADQPVAEAP